MELDDILSDIDTTDISPVEEPSVDSSSLLPTEAGVEPVDMGKQQAPQQSSTENADDFDDSVPLTPREKILLARLEAITGENLALSKPTSAAPAPIPTAVDKNFLDGLDVDEVLATPENLNKLLLSVYNSAMEESSKLSAERILQNLPQIMSTYVTNHLTMAKMAEKFYTDNPDLEGASQTVSAIANKIAAEHPEYTAEQVFDASATEARKVLRIKATSNPAETIKAAPKPAFVGSSRGRSSIKAPVLSDIEKGVLDLISN